MTTKALAAWQELNDRQQGTLRAIYDLDQENEVARKMKAADGHYDNMPAAKWRRIDFAHDPSDRRLVGMTELQSRLARKGWDNQGNGSTMAALSVRELIKLGGYGTGFGRMETVVLTRFGRAAARAGTSLVTGTARKAALGQRAWEVLAMLWACDQAGQSLEWSSSTTIDRVLIDKHVPPLAQHLGWQGYAITDRGRDFYREHYAAHVAAHPEVHAPHPDGTGAEPWPPEADTILAAHYDYYRALCAAWSSTLDAQHAADKESAIVAPVPETNLPAEVAELLAARRALWQDTARQRAQLAAEHVADLHQRGLRAARCYALAAVHAFNSAVAGKDPRAALDPPGQDDSWDEPRLTPPAETGIPAVDSDAKKLHAAAVGAPLRRRGPAPTFRRRGHTGRTSRPSRPGNEFAALADFLREHTYDGALFRRLHPAGLGEERHHDG